MLYAFEERGQVPNVKYSVMGRKVAVKTATAH